ncbi:tetratricopeptide repeat protein [Pseudalkalibacillus caeni]|uniref:Tetratricopeptide repeat protein n=1 Tax=Exobacillus caeni TaxID=2574798 RepID=A0A5R9F6K4_9BACL|nr:tetratricopeptide repeat protein [Pseudalkalibacillus caeni]TLS39207.1 tetratricopeptide repeat protein [Pseudalkalibacillus caeni]
MINKEWSDLVMDNNNDQEKGKVLYFPNLTQKLVEKGMAALKDKKYEEAYEHFNQLLEISPDHPQGHFGQVLCLVEFGRLTEAAERCEKMLNQDIGEYFDVMQVYISILVQLGKYQKVVTMIEAVLQENKMPPNIAESFYQLLHFSRKMTSYDFEDELIQDDEKGQDLQQLETYLQSEETEKQCIAIQKLSKSNDPLAYELYKEYLKDSGKDPLLKSMILQILREKNIDDNIMIHKFGKDLIINPSRLVDIFKQEFSVSVKEELASKVEHNNPTLYEMCIQVWWHYLFAITPFDADPPVKELWAAAIQKVGSEINGIEVIDEEIAEEYGIKVNELREAAGKIDRIEKQAFIDPGI